MGPSFVYYSLLDRTQRGINDPLWPVISIVRPPPLLSLSLFWFLLFRTRSNNSPSGELRFCRIQKGIHPPLDANPPSFPGLQSSGTLFFFPYIQTSDFVLKIGINIMNLTWMFNASIPFTASFDYGVHPFQFKSICVGKKKLGSVNREHNPRSN